MVFKRLFRKFTVKKEYTNRFLKFYHENRKRLTKERKSAYHERRKSGICVRCSQKTVPGIVFCKYHRQKQKEYNRKARKK
jgi:nitrate/TMAO reductase-like tetraheme cytochrome c subunit